LGQETNDNLGMLDSQPSCLIASYTFRAKDRVNSVDSGAIRPVSDSMDIDLKSCGEPLIMSANESGRNAIGTYLINHSV
jgi:hypothetical protein